MEMKNAFSRVQRKKIYFKMRKNEEVWILKLNKDQKLNWVRWKKPFQELKEKWYWSCKLHL